jgi:hypothetical protein
MFVLHHSARYQALFCSALVLFSWSAISRAAPPVPDFRRLIVHVVNEHGEPMAGAKVQLVGTGRDALQAMDVFEFPAEQNLPGVWRFVSNARGRFTARFACCAGWDSDKLTGTWMPGWGAFYFIAEAGGLRGVSLCVNHDTKESAAGGAGDDEWTQRGTVKTRTKPVTMTLVMRRGLRVSGRVIDTAGRPVAGFSVGIEEDLHSNHHTGYGDEIFRQVTSTDREGKYTFEHVYPNTFYLAASLEESSPSIWIGTRVRRGHWRREPVDVIVPHRGESEIGLDLQVSATVPYRYWGRVVDENGRPVAGADVSFSISKNREVRTYEDTHNNLHVSTDEEGFFELRTTTPFCLYMNVTAKGYREYSEDFEGKGSFKRPGKSLVRLRRE